MTNKKYPELPQIEHWLNETYTASQMRWYADATCAMRAAEAAPSELIEKARKLADDFPLAGRDDDTFRWALDAEQMIRQLCALNAQAAPRPAAPQEYETFAQSLVKKYGFCNWQCKDAWEAGYSAALDTQPSLQPAAEAIPNWNYSEIETRIKRLMRDTPYPNSFSVAQAMKQLVNELYAEYGGKTAQPQEAAPSQDAGALAQLRHLYANMVNGAVRDADGAGRIAKGILGPAIERLERAAPSQDAEDSARLDWLIEQRAYVVSDPDACPGYWVHWNRGDGSTWVQVEEYASPRLAIDAARKQAKEGGGHA